MGSRRHTWWAVVVWLPRHPIDLILVSTKEQLKTNILNYNLAMFNLESRSLIQGGWSISPWDAATMVAILNRLYFQLCIFCTTDRLDQMKFSKILLQLIIQKYF